jgi:hypothetical protein
MASKVQMMSVSISEAQPAIEFVVLSGKNCYIEGPAGVGKTELIAQIAAKLGAKLYTSRLAQVEPSDLFGFPVPTTLDDGTMITQHTRPTVIPPSDETDQLYIWFFDELNRANKQAVNAVMQATDSSRRIGPHKLPKNIVIVGAGNPANDDAYDTSMLDAAVNNRYVHLKMHYDTNSLVSYAKSKEWNANVISFIQVTGGALFRNGTYDGLPFCSPRSLETLSGLENNGLSNNKVMHAMLVQGCLGPELGLAYHSHCFELQPLKWSELSTDDGKARLGRMVQPENIRQDLISFTNEDIRKHFEKKAGMTDKDFATLSEYLCTIPADQSAALISQLKGEPKVSEAFVNHMRAKGQAIGEHIGSALKG